MKEYDELRKETLDALKEFDNKYKDYRVKYDYGYAETGMDRDEGRGSLSEVYREKKKSHPYDEGWDKNKG